MSAPQKEVKNSIEAVETVVKAIEQGSVEGVEEYLKAGGDPNASCQWPVDSSLLYLQQQSLTVGET